MRILYLSRLENEGFAGLTYSVPNQVKAQAQFDTVHWHNLKIAERDEWRNTGLFTNENDFHFSLRCFEKMYWKPDLIVFEGFYAFHPTILLLSILMSRIPYVIVPRCAFTMGDQKKKRIKKLICNFLFYKWFSRNALAVQYLTNKECEDSKGNWNSRYYIEPNGIDVNIDKPKDRCSNFPIRISYIGRLEMYQKGLDVLLCGISRFYEKYGTDNLRIDIYGNSVSGSAETIKNYLAENKLSKFVKVHDPVFDKNKESILMKSDYFLLTSRYEGMPMGLLEACSYGIPVIITPGTNMSHEIQSMDAGFVCELTSDSIANALIEAVEADSDEYRKLSRGALAVANLFSWEKIARNTHYDLAKFRIL